MLTGPAGDSALRSVAAALARATDRAARAAAPLVGSGDKVAIDQLAVDAMRLELAGAAFDGVVVVGEGEKDSAPWLYTGERLGNGTGSEWDVAVDPIDGTTLAALGLRNSIAMIAAAPRGSMLDASASYYMEKIVCGPAGAGVVELERPLADNLRSLAAARGCSVGELTVAVLDRPRNREHIDAVTGAGARLELIRDGDVAAALATLVPGSGIDVSVGIGGSPEGVATACAVKAAGGVIEGRVVPESEAARERIVASGLRVDRVYRADDLVASDDTVFVATAVTDSWVARGIRVDAGVSVAETIVFVAGAPRVELLVTRA